MVDCDRLGIDYYRLAWFNPQGGWDYFNFTKVAHEVDNLDKEVYLKNNFIFNSNNTTYTTNPSLRGNDYYRLNASKTYQITTNWLNDFSSIHHFPPYFYYILYRDRDIVATK